MNDKKKAPEKNLNEHEQAQKNKTEQKLEKREKTLRIINIAVLMTVFAGIALFMTFGKRPNVSYEENRNLEKLPEFTWESYWKGDFTEQLGKYYNDTVPMRSTWKLFISNFRAHLGIKYDGGVTIVGELPVIEKPTKPSDSTSKPANSIPEVVIKKPGDTSSNNKIPEVVIPGTSNASTSSTANTDKKVPDVVIPKPSSGILTETNESVSEETFNNQYNTD